MVDVQTIRALASMTYIELLDAYVLHLGNWKAFDDFIDDC